MKLKIQWGSQFLLGLMFLVFGLNGFFDFIDKPPLPETAMKFMSGLAAGGFFFPFVKAVEIVCGILLLTNRFVPLALLILAPIVVNIVLYHAVLAPLGGGPAYLSLVLILITMFAYKKQFDSVLVFKAERST